MSPVPRSSSISGAPPRIHFSSNPNTYRLASNAYSAVPFRLARVELRSKHDERTNDEQHHQEPIKPAASILNDIRFCPSYSTRLAIHPDSNAPWAKRIGPNA